MSYDSWLEKPYHEEAADAERAERAEAEDYDDYDDYIEALRDQADDRAFDEQEERRLLEKHGQWDELERLGWLPEPVE